MVFFRNIFNFRKKNHSPLRLSIRHKTIFPTFISRIKDLFSFKKKSLKERILKKLTFRSWSLIVLVLFIVGVGYLTFGRVIQIYKQASNAQPISYWQFDEGTGTDVYDLQEANDGTLISGTGTPAWVSQGQCVRGTCLSFDGNADSVEAPNDGLSPTAGTIELWTKPTTAPDGSDEYIFMGNRNNNRIYIYRLNSTGNFAIRLGTTSGVDTGEVLTQDQWYHLALAWNNGTYYAYMNGNQVSTGAYSGLATVDTCLNWGGFSNCAEARNSFYGGYIDETQFYDYARTAEQIKVDYERVAELGFAAVLGSQDEGFMWDGLQGYWKMDESTWVGDDAVLDSSGNLNSGTAQGNATVGLGKFGNGGVFDGAGDYVNVSNNSVLNPTGDFTISLWVKPDVTNAYQGVFNKMATSSDVGYRLILRNDGYVWCDVGTGSLSTGSKDVVTYSSGVWQHFVCVRKVGEISIYKNGVLEDQTSVSTSAISTTEDLKFASQTSGSYLDGSLDEVRLYNRALNQSEVSALYSWAPGPVAYYPLDENTGSTAYDKSGNGTNGTLTNMEGNEWISGKLGSGLNVDDTTEYISVGVTTGQAWTISAWSLFPLNSTASNYNTMIRYGSNAHHIIVEKSTGEIGSYNSGFFSTGYDTDSLSGWHHISALGVGSSTAFYIDGVNVGAAATNITSGVTEIGGISGTLQQWGGIDDVRIYNYPRTQEQIIQDMNGGHPAPGSPVGSALLHYRLDEGYGTTANNVGNAGSTLNGTISGPSWTNDGKYGKALDFASASNNYIGLSSNPAIDSLQELTLSAWINLDSYGESGGGRIIEKNGASDNGFSFWVNGNSNNRLLFAAAGWDGTAGQWNTATNSILTGQWYHVAVTYNYSSVNNEAQFYINGKKAETINGTEPTGSFATETNELRIGANYQSPPIREFDGKIDEVKIYNFSLTEDQVKAEYNQGKALVLGAGSTGLGGTTPSNAASREYCVPGDSSTCNAPVGEWKFDEGVGGSANDTSGNGNVGSFGAGNSTPTWVKGKQGNGLSFDGNDYVSAGDMSNVDFGSGNFTFSFWVKLSSLTQNRAHFIAKDAIGGRQFDLLWDSGNNNGNDIRIDYFKSGEVDVYGRTDTNIISDTNWHHVVAGRNGSSFFFYIDGEAKTVAASGGTHGSMQGTSTNVTIGKRNYTGFEEPLEGIMDNVRIYDYALTQAQVAWEYNQGAPIAWYRMDEGSGSAVNNAAKNSSGQAAGMNGTLTIGGSGSQTTTTQAWTNGATGKFNASLNFDGTDDYINLDSHVSEFNVAAPVSISAWVKTSDDSVRTLYSFSDDSQTDRYFIVYVGDGVTGTITNELITIARANDATGNSVAYATSSRNELFDGQWHHITITSDSSSWSIYLDGNLKPVTVGSGSSNDGAYGGINGADTARIGIRDLSTAPDSLSFNGQIDDVKIFNYALTSAQVKTEMAHGAVRFQ